MQKTRLLQASVATLLVAATVSLCRVSGQVIDQPVSTTQAVESFEFNSAMMDSTFKVFGPSSRPDEAGKARIGTMFLVGRPTVKDPKRLSYVLVTAAHVLNDIRSDTATLVIRMRNASKDLVRAEWPLPIRKNGLPLWQAHPTADVAAIYATLPDSMVKQYLPMEFLATDEDFVKYEFHPGDEILTVGYPYGPEAMFGYPVIRSGRLASYPLTPATKVRTYLADFSVFGGNSGGPVYLDSVGRVVRNRILIDQQISRIIGLVRSTPLFDNKNLGVTQVVPAHFIKETIEMLPPK